MNVKYQSCFFRSKLYLSLPLLEILTQMQQKNCAKFIKCADFTNKQSIHINLGTVKGILNYVYVWILFFLYLPVYINMLPTLSNRDNKRQNYLKDNSVELNCETNACLKERILLINQEAKLLIYD